MQVLDNGEMLGAHGLALAAADTIPGPAEGSGEAGIVGGVNRPFFHCLPHVLIVEGKILGDGDFLGAALGTVGAAGAGDGDLGFEELRRLGDDALFRLGERGEFLHKGEVVLQLRQVAHAGEHHFHALQRGGEADGPGGGGGGAVGGKEALYLLGDIG